MDVSNGGEKSWCFILPVVLHSYFDCGQRVVQQPHGIKLSHIGHLMPVSWMLTLRLAGPFRRLEDSFWGQFGLVSDVSPAVSKAPAARVGQQRVSLLHALLALGR